MGLVLSHSSGGWKSEMKVLAGLVPSAGAKGELYHAFLIPCSYDQGLGLPDLQMHLSNLHLIFPCCSPVSSHDCLLQANQ